MKCITIEERKIGHDYPPLVIPEIGINHNGDINIAKQMIDAAAKAGAQIVKFQSHVIDDEMSHHAKKTIPGNADVSIYQIMDSCALSATEEIELKSYTQDKGLIYLSTPFSRAAADRLESMDVNAYKIGSGECNNYPLVEHIAAFGKPIICSTGMNSIETIKQTVKIFEKYQTPYVLLHCTNVYPTPPQLVRLGAMDEMSNAFPQALIGLSDHTVNNAACLAAVGYGACVLERHFTDSKQRIGPDIVCSMDAKELSQLIQWSAQIQLMRGGNKAPIAQEKETIDFAYASVVSIKDIKCGELFSKENLWVKRPGTGEMHASQYEKILGAKSTRNIVNDTQLKWSDVQK